MHLEEISKRKILVVDDEASIRELLKDAFSKAGYLVRLASGSEDALAILGQERIPVMFIDLGLGLETMNGFELCEHIRKDSPDAIIHALTGYAALFVPHEIREAGFDSHLAKPISIETLYKVAKDSFEKVERTADKPLNKIIERILIIDDNDHFRKMLRKMLGHEGYEVSEAVNGKEGIRRHSKQPADLIIIDIIMPGKEGIETMMEIKEMDPDVKFVVISGGSWYGSDTEFEMARALGARTLKKPFEREQILSIIKRL